MGPLALPEERPRSQMSQLFPDAVFRAGPRNTNTNQMSELPVVREARARTLPPGADRQRAGRESCLVVFWGPYPRRRRPDMPCRSEGASALATVFDPRGENGAQGE